MIVTGVPWRVEKLSAVDVPHHLKCKGGHVDTNDHVQQLMERYPRLFGGANAVLGVCYPLGWSGLMVRLCTALDALLSESEAQRFRVEQVKEKFGTLRFYYAVDGRPKMRVDVVGLGHHTRLENQPRLRRRFPTKEVDALISAAESESKVTCAICGQPGVLRKYRWLYVACDSCNALRRRKASEGDSL